MNYNISSFSHAKTARFGSGSTILRARGNEPLSLEHTYPNPSPVEIIKAAQCFDYQACETDDWKESVACKIIQHIEGTAIRMLPGYEQAPWGLDRSKAAA